MKKLLLTILVGCFLLTGCSFTTSKNDEQKSENKVEGKTEKTEETLVCSKNTESTVNFVTEMSYRFKNDKAEELVVKYSYDLSSYNAEQKTVFKNMCETDAMKNTLGMVDCEEELVGDNYIVKGKATKLLETTVGSLKANKASFAAQGWTCYTK